MRPVHLLLTVCLVSPIGCSYLLINSGTNPYDLKTKAQVHEAFGVPANTTQTNDQVYDEFFSHRKIAESWKDEYFLIGDISTLGLCELIWFPQQLFVAGRRVVAGQQLRFTYDVAGTVTGFSLDGESFPGLGPVPETAPDHPAAAVTTPPKSER